MGLVRRTSTDGTGPTHETRVTDVRVFQTIGQLVTRYPYVVLIVWVASCSSLSFSANRFDEVVVDGEFAYLPDDVDSRRAEQLFNRAFGPGEGTDQEEIVRSNIVLVVSRRGPVEIDENGEKTGGLTERDKQFVEQELKPRLLELADEFGGLAVTEAPDAEDDDESPAEAGDVTPPEPESDAEAEDASEREPVIAGVRTWNDKSIGDLLLSEDGKATLVVVELVTEFLEERNHEIIKAIDDPDDPSGGLVVELKSDPELREEWGLGGLEITVSGIAVAGRDMRIAQQESAEATELLTLVLVLVLLVVIYRAPLLAILPMMTVFVSVKVAIGVLSLLADNGLVGLFTGVKSYIVVIMYGAGVDYCLFLIARYKEELDHGASTEAAIQSAISRVGAALAASASTTVCGIGMLYFADFGKFSQAGIAIALSLLFVLVAALTFTPALLFVTGRYAFWPQVSRDRLVAAGWVSPTSLVSRIIESGLFSRVWERVGRALEKRPATIWCVTVSLMVPFAVVGVTFYDHLSYGLLSELPREATSVVGAKAVQDHFPAGTVGPVTVLVKNPEFDFTSREAKGVIGDLTDRIAEEREELGVADVRTLTNPLGIHVKMSIAKRAVFRHRAPQYFVSGPDAPDHSLMRMEVVFENDPFSRHSIEEFERFRAELPGLLPDELRSGTTIEYLGATPSIRDLKIVTDHDQVKINLVVSLAVFLILVVLLGKRSPGLVLTLVVAHFAWMFAATAQGLSLLGPTFLGVDLVLVLAVVALRGNASAKSSYLMLSVLFSYFVTLGVTITTFYALSGAEGFAGLDWKVPMFLFTILVAVGQDYNIYFVTRVEEEQERHGPVEGVGVALARTGGIISSCGIIMAGTFASLLAGSLDGMRQLGFALAFGVLLDTFVVRPILVPAYLILLHGGRFGVVGRFLGAEHQTAEAASPEAAPAGSSARLEVGHGNENA